MANSTRIMFDCETTGLNVYNDEIITAYLVNSQTGETYDFRSQVNKWNKEAESIHGISEYEMHTYQTKDYAIEELIKWLPKEFELVCYANQLSELGYVTFDYAILKMEIMDHLGIYHEAQLPLNFTPYSVHSFAKQCARDGVFTPLKGKKNRDSFKQEDVYKALFNDTYNAHNAEADVLAMVRIESELLNKLNNVKSIAERNQLSLI